MRIAGFSAFQSGQPGVDGGIPAYGSGLRKMGKKIADLTCSVLGQVLPLYTLPGSAAHVFGFSGMVQKPARLFVQVLPVGIDEHFLAVGKGGILIRTAVGCERDSACGGCFKQPPVDLETNGLIGDDPRVPVKLEHVLAGEALLDGKAETLCQ